MRLKKIQILVKNSEDPISKALDHTHCPICKKALDNNWQCLKDKIQLFFISEPIK